MKQFYIFIICFAIWSGCYAEEKKELDKFDIVEKFLNTLHIPELFDTLPQSIVEGALKKNPHLENKKEILEKLFVQKLSYQACKKELCQFYLQRFSIEELETLTILFQSPVAQKYFQYDERIRAYCMQIIQNKLEQSESLLGDYLE
ncbi:MAG: hypothetical protein KBC30_11240 [Planctomycetes bacterium]|jgi:hypothetical protein|nr:hypothetical protein [Planctomycetota bacterium]HON45543.1 hypothetical protein [Planctomycetota bacterium]HPY75983.1 hypothetical protein [Planctomycetota bacterium]HQB01511.1 hypothetical protein [Planctomycetota bacterium]HRU52602.1 hypothetical protein [Planctomycetota bacterium]